MNGETRKEILALSPLAVFLLVYMVSSIAAGDFYRVPVSVAFLLACIFSVCISRGALRERLDTFSSGAGNPNVLLMIWIFILAGAFSRTATDIGAVDATVSLALRIVPPGMLFAGLFLTSCFISMAIGTSVGTIAALVPIASGIAARIGFPVPYLAAIIVGGAFFGDNLSFISDTTIAATRAVGCGMKDKFKANMLIVLPAVVIVTFIYLFRGHELSAVPDAAVGDWYKLIPYLTVIILALSGLNVTLILCIGIAINAAIGFATGVFSWDAWLISAGQGISGMSDLIIVTLLAGGLLELIRAGGGLDLIIRLLTSRIGGKRGAEMSIALLTCMANVCTANNTIAIITTGGISKDICDRFGLEPRRVASIMDTFSCFVQGLIPYGAQLLMAAGLAGCPTTALIPHLYYPFLTGLSALLAILFRFPRKHSKPSAI